MRTALLSFGLMTAASIGLSASVAAQTSSGHATSSGMSSTGTSTSGMMTTSTGGSATTSGFCIPGGLGCGPGSDLTPLGPDQILTGDGVVTVPEPSGAALLMLGLGLYAARTIGRRRRK